MPIREIALSKQFIKAFTKFVSKQPKAKLLIEASIIKLAEDAFLPQLNTLKLSGKLYGYLACSCGYDCRIIFSIEKNSKTKAEVI